MPTGTFENDKRRTEMACIQSGDFSKLYHQEIAKLAYSFWELRGRPVGSPEIDWCRAELELASVIFPL